MRRLGKILARSAMAVAALVIVVYFVRAFDARTFPDLGPEYRIHFAGEFRAADESTTDWNRYLEIENALAAELQQKIATEQRPDSLLDRYTLDSITNPARFDGNWNRSYELAASSPVGVAVMLHGLSDSPYSMLSTAQAAVGAGYNVVVPRMPGHGFAVGGLLQARWQDWSAAVRVAIRRAIEIRQPGQPLLLVGYSNGGLLALDYALRCHEDESMVCPDRIVLLSPAIAVSPTAFVTSWHSMISWIPYFEKFRWLSVLPEIDPFKFTSFPKRAVWEIHQLTKRTHSLLENPKHTQRLPPILTFQSVVDNTVGSDAVVSLLYERLPDNGSELVVYDVNRNSTIVHLMQHMPEDPVERFKDRLPLKYAVTVLRNGTPHGFDISAVSMASGQTDSNARDTGLKWPLGVYSLSHIALPFASFDPLYGDGSSPDANQAGIVLGAIAPRGELGVLLLSPAYFLRTRHNPFYAFQVLHMSRWLSQAPH